jgi:hypothetical protein
MLRIIVVLVLCAIVESSLGTRHHSRKLLGHGGGYRKKLRKGGTDMQAEDAALLAEINSVLTLEQRMLPLAPEDRVPTIVLWTDPSGFHAGTKHFEDYRFDCATGPCSFTKNTSRIYDESTIGLMAYGASVSKLPTYRPHSHTYILYNEESICTHTILGVPEFLNFFNFTMTLDPFATFPAWPNEAPATLTSLLKPPLVSTAEKSKLLAEGRAPIIYVHSANCHHEGSGRDYYIEELMKHIEVDSYGECLKNKEFPFKDHWYSWDDAYQKFAGGYKFILGAPNCISNDYVNDNFWRPLNLGIIPIWTGAYNIKDWQPSEHSIVNAHEYKSPKALAEFIKYLSANDTAYDEYMAWRVTGIQNDVLKQRHRDGLNLDSQGKGALDDASPGRGYCKLCEAMLSKQEEDETGEGFTSGRLTPSIVGVQNQTADYGGLMKNHGWGEDNKTIQQATRNSYGNATSEYYTFQKKMVKIKDAIWARRRGEKDIPEFINW